MEARFGAVLSEPLPPRYNAAPSQALPVILNTSPERISRLRWGLSPLWKMNSKRRDGIINVRMETLRDKATFQADLLERRCLVLADGFYEWQAVGKGPKIPYCFTLRDGSPFAFAGIWEVSQRKDGSTVPTFAIITTEANELMAPIHHRMPVILTPDTERRWLFPALERAELLAALQPVGASDLRAYKVSRLVNRAAVDSPEVIQAVADKAA